MRGGVTGGGGRKEARGGLSIPLTRLSSPLLFRPLYGRTRSTGGQRWLAVDLSFFSPPYFRLFVLLTSPSPLSLFLYFSPAKCDSCCHQRNTDATKQAVLAIGLHDFQSESLVPGIIWIWEE